MTWRAARCLLTLRAEIDAAHPARDKSADGTRASAAHHQQNPHSDHEPDANGVVHAIDITTKPVGEQIDPDTVCERIRQLGKQGDPRLAGNGYIIRNRRIASAAHAPAWEWHDYTGTDPHTGHFHLSVTLDAHADDDGPWHLYDTAPAPQEDDDMASKLWRPVGAGHPNVGGEFVQEGHLFVALSADTKQQLANSETGGDPAKLHVQDVEPELWKAITVNYTNVVAS